MIEQIYTFFTIEMIFFWLNLGVLPFWFVLIVFPQSQICKVFVTSIFPIFLCFLIHEKLSFLLSFQSSTFLIEFPCLIFVNLILLC